MATSWKKVFAGQIVSVETGRVTLPNQHEMDVELVRHPGGAAVVAIDDQMRVCLIRQYRFILDDWLWELPAGKREMGDAEIATAQRELAEEAGLEAEEWLSLGRSVSSPGVFTERVALYLARGLRSVTATPEAGEILECHFVPFEEAVTWAESGVISDAKTALGIFRARQILFRESGH